VTATGAPDPLGRRSLFWATGTTAGSVAKTEKDRPLGKLAFYSDAQPNGANASGPAGSRVGAAAGSAKKAVRSAVSGIEALSLLAPVTIECSACEERSVVGVHQFVALHLPVWLWRPGKGYTRLMSCPACKKRAWVSASWRPWEN
jgi:hypothetical protein